MTSSRFSDVSTLALLLVLVLAAAAPAAAVNVADQSVPGESAVGETVEATFTLDTLYQEPNFQKWALQGATGLENVTWTVAYKNPSGEVFTQRQYNGQTFSQPGISADGSEFQDPVTEIEITVRGDVPAVEEYTYDEPEAFLVAEFSQKAGQTGSTNTVDSWGAHHYTTGDEGSPGSKQARAAIDAASSAIADAQGAGADVSEANASLQTAIDFYELGQFGKAVENAETAEQQAADAEASKKSSEQTTQLLMYGGAGLLVLVVLGGGFWYYQQQQDDYDKLG